MPHYLAISKDRQHDILDLIGNQLRAARIVRTAGREAGDRRDEHKLAPHGYSARLARDAEPIALLLEFLADYMQQTLAGEMATDEMRAYFERLEKE